MSNVTLTVESSAALAKAEVFKNSLEVNMKKNAAYYGKVVAHHLFRWTTPIGSSGNQWPVKPMQGRIGSDVRKMYPTWDDKDWMSSAFKMIENEHGRPKANAWWAQYKRGINTDYGAESERYDPELGYVATGKDITDPVLKAKTQAKRLISDKKRDDSRYAARRKQIAPKMFKPDAAPIAMVAAGARRKALRDREKRAGMAKAAWMQAAQSFGGRIRFTGGTWKIEFDKRARQPLDAINKAQVGKGTAIVSGHTINLRLHNKIRYADEAIGDNLWRAEVNAEKHLRYVMSVRLKQTAKKAFSGRSGKVEAA